jgi:rubrerythrin
MKNGIYLLVSVMAAGLGVNYPSRSPSLSQQAMRDLTAAMHHDAFAYAKYSLYAKQARENGHAELAKLFEQTANSERFEHFAKEAQLAGFSGADLENLKEAVNNEVDELGKHAAAPQDKLVADLFEEIRHDELRHRDAFSAALATFENNNRAAK